ECDCESWLAVKEINIKNMSFFIWHLPSRLHSSRVNVRANKHREGSPQKTENKPWAFKNMLKCPFIATFLIQLS
ncbi:MAG: hypothetical protein HW374_302, partial [Bacteroidetes bacterium]|nr:hypothetical protein [Bacteroidota bacterium]